MSFLLELFATGVAVWIVAMIVPGVSVKNFGTAVWVAFLLALINATIGWVLKLLTIPFNWLTFGLIHFIISVLMIMLVDKLVKNFKIKNFWWAVLFAILISVFTNFILRLF
ncbi:MAG: phage holin family protein [Cytophagaceae bacterium]